MKELKVDLFNSKIVSKKLRVYLKRDLNKIINE